jgi:hypothetical protein
VLCRKRWFKFPFQDSRLYPAHEVLTLVLLRRGWLAEKHGRKTRRSWRKLPIGMDAATREIVAAALTTNDVDDASQVGPLLDQVAGPVASFTGDGAYDQDSVYRAVIDRDPRACPALTEAPGTL